MEEIEFYVQYYKSGYNTVDTLPQGITLSPQMKMLSYPGNPNIDGHVDTMYFDNGSGKYSKRTTEFPFKKVRGLLVRNYLLGKFVVINAADADQFSYRRGPTIPCYLLILLNNGYTIPILHSQIHEVNDHFISDYKDGCSLRWKPIEMKKEEGVEEDMTIII